MKLIQIYEHKKVKINGEIKDMLKTVDVVFAEINDNIAILNEMEGKIVKRISNLINEIKDEDYVYTEVNEMLMRLGDDSLTDTEVLENAKGLLLNLYYEVYEKDGFILGLKNVFNDKIKEQYDESAMPSVNNQLESIVDNNLLEANADFTSPLLEKENNSGQQDANVFKNFTNYDIKETYNRLKEIIFGQDKQLKIFWQIL